MKIVIAMDSFKGSLKSLEAGHAVKDAVLEIFPDAEVRTFPLADGGEGTIDALAYEGGMVKECEVTGPLGDKVTARYALLGDTAVLEMAEAAGLTLVPKEKLNPLNTTTYGVGELILAAARDGARRFIVGLGGSATNDAGLGMLTALGVKFFDRDGQPVGIYGRDVANVASISFAGLSPLILMTRFAIACDVKNPLCGPNGCSSIFGPQKGATTEIIAQMDKSIERFAALAEEAALERTYVAADIPGAGAAGGLGFAFLLLDGNLRPGARLILDALGMEEDLRRADIFITGEGKLDGESALGKAPATAVKLAKSVRRRVVTIAFAGCTSPEAAELHKIGLDAYFPIIQAPMSQAAAMEKPTTTANLKQAVREALRLFSAARTSLG